MPKINKIKTIRDFLLVIKNKNPYFFAVYTITFNRKKFTNIYELIKLFR